MKESNQKYTLDLDQLLIEENNRTDLINPDNTFEVETAILPKQIKMEVIETDDQIKSTKADELED